MFLVFILHSLSVVLVQLFRVFWLADYCEHTTQVQATAPNRLDKASAEFFAIAVKDRNAAVRFSENVKVGMMSSSRLYWEGEKMY